MKFEFKNYKGIQSATIDLSPIGDRSPVVTLVGLNESGKTTVLEAIDRFVAGEESEEIGPKTIVDWKHSKPHDLIPISKRANFNDVIRIAAEVELDDADRVSINKELASGGSGFRLDSLAATIRITNEYSFVSSKFKKSITKWTSELGSGRTKQGRTTKTVTAGGLRSVWGEVVSAIRNRLPTIWYFPNFLFEFPESITLSSETDETPENKLYRNLIQDVLESCGADLDVQKHIVDRARSSDPADIQSLGQLEVAVSREVTRSVVQGWNRLFSNQELQGKRVFVKFRLESHDAESRVVAVFSLEDADGMFSISDRSLGFRWFFVYLLLTTYRGRRQSPSGNGVMFLFDEPASNLHSSAQAMLLESLSRLGQTAHVIYTTHSHHLINPAWLEATYVVANEGASIDTITADFSGATDIKIEKYASFANANPSRSQYFQPVLDVLDYRPSALELVPDVVMTEGKSDYYLLRYYERHVSKSEDLPDRLNFLPGTGSASLITPIQLYLAWARPFVVLLDSDKAGLAARRRYEDSFGEAVHGLITDLSTEVGGPTALRGIESLLEESDRLAFQAVVNPTQTTYDKKVLARGVEHAFAIGAVIPLSVEARDKLDRLTSGLRVRLRPPSV